jgi:subtilisin family serine protease
MRQSVLALLLLSSTAVFAQERVSVVIELASPPAIESYLNAAVAGKSSASALRAAVTAARNEIAVVDAEQQSVVAQVDAIPSSTVLFTMQRLFNGIAVDVDASQLDAIRKIPGVKSVQPLPIVPRANTSSVPLIGGPDVWRAAAPFGATGKNVKVGLIDTGLDYIHRDFGGDGNYAGKTFTGSTFPTTAKVAGGTDLAGDAYDPSSADVGIRTPKPDGDPMDCAGHGSHVGGTIAGFGVKKDNTTYTGPYDGPFDASIFSIGPGVAPEAKIFAIRVFGCNGATGLIAPALEWALDPNKDGDFSDHMDVVNMSLGSDFGSSNNVNIVAADNLAKAGCVVVASAGNSGDTYYITGTPATGNHVLSVAASVDALEPADALQVTAPSAIAKGYTAHHSVNFDFLNAAAVSGTVARPASQLTGCSSFPASDRTIIIGKIALLDWSDNECGSATRVGNAAAAGAIGVILRHTKNDLDIAIAGATSIPSTLVPKDTGDLLLANLGGPAGNVTAAFNADELGALPVVTAANNDLLSSFSSRGPRLDDNGLKPEITAPGQSIWSVRAKSGFRGTSLSGTSMAAPHVTGAIALLKQLHPTWTPDELKALVMSTASHDLFTGAGHTGSRYAVSRVGAGRIDVGSAARTREAFLSTAQSNLGIIGISFGAPDVPGTFTASRDCVILNKGSGTITTYRVAYDPAVTQPGVTITVPDTVTIPASGSVTFPVRIDANAAAMRHHRDPSLSALQTNVTRSWLGEASGWVTLTADGKETLRLPVFAAPRPASAMSAASATFPDATGNFSMKLKGTTLATGSGPEDENAVVAAFELSNIGTRNTSLPTLLNIKYTGVASNFAAQKAAGKGVADSTIYFAVATFGPWTSPVQTPVRIDIDTNGDGIDDFRLTTGDLATFTSAANAASDVFIATLCTSALANCKALPRNVVDASVADMVLFNTNVMVLPVNAADLGLNSTTTAFTYRVRTGISSGIDILPRQSYDVARPGMSFSATNNAPFGFVDSAANTISVAYDKTAFTNAKSKGILLLHLHNESGKHEEIVTAATPPRHRAAGR